MSGLQASAGTLLAPLLPSSPPSPTSCLSPTSIWRLGLTLGAGYALNYFWRYPIFLLPKTILDEHVLSIGRTPLSLHTCLSLAFTFGFGLGKFPATSVMTSAIFFSRRRSVMLALLIVPMFLATLPPLLLLAAPGAAARVVVVLGLLISCCFQSWVYGGVLTYVEGRLKMETLLAVFTALFIYSGNLSRGAASLVLSFGLQAEAMPLLLGACACALSSVFIISADRLPGPSKMDVAARCERKHMSAAQRWAFARTWWLGIASMIVSYATMTGLRSFRDFYAKQIFASALDVAEQDVPAYFYFIVDAPGAVLACIGLVLVNRIQSNKRAITFLFAGQIGSLSLCLLGTVLYKLQWLGGAAWQVLLGVGIYVAYGLMQTPVFERLFAASRTQGTCTFLVYISDGFGYIATISLLLYQTFHGSLSNPQSDDAAVAALYEGCLLGGSVLMLAMSVICLVYFNTRLPGEGEHVGEFDADSTTPSDHSRSSREFHDDFGRSTDRPRGSTQEGLTGPPRTVLTDVVAG